MAYLGKTYPNILHHNATASIHNLARILRKSETTAEKLLWRELKNRKCAGLKFRRQHPFSKFVLDFYCHEKKLVVEVDGAVHNNSDVKERDENRTYELEQAGLTVIRIRNEEIFMDLNMVLERIAKVAETL
jgi:very-short-patch-repair endonuclease